MPDILTDRKITQQEADKMTRPLELDLTAVFNMMQEDIIKTVTQAGKDITPERLIDVVTDIIRGEKDPDSAHEVTKSFGFDLDSAVKGILRQETAYGLPIRIEQEPGSIRSGYDNDGNYWETNFDNAYGYIEDTLGVDGDEVDVYLGDYQETDMVYIIHQLDPVSHEYDEDKVMMFFESPEEAKKTYQKHYNRPGMFGGLTEVDITQFKNMLAQRKGSKLMSEGLIMPIPEPTAGETEEEYLPRCMSAQSGESKTQDQKLAICYSKFRDAKKAIAIKFIDQLRIEKAAKGNMELTVNTNEATAGEVLVPLLEKLREIGNPGHSFEISVEPDDKDYHQSFGFDGDGNHRIGDISIKKIDKSTLIKSLKILKEKLNGKNIRK